MREFILSPFGLFFPFIMYAIIGTLMICVAALIDYITKGKSGLLKQLEMDAKWRIV